MMSRVFKVLSVVAMFAQARAIQENPCEADMNNICSMSFPTAYQAIFDARFCLRANVAAVSSACVEYLTVTSPSIVEPCFEDIGKHCKNVVPGNNQMNACLSKYITTLAPQCMAAVIKETEHNNFRAPVLTTDRHLTADPVSNFDLLQNMWSDLNRYDVIRGANAAFQGFYDRLNEVEVSLSDVLATLNNSKSNSNNLRGNENEA